MLYTDNIGLKKPAYSDPADIADINENMDTIDREFGNRYLKSETYSVKQANNAIAQAIEALPNGLVYRGAVNYYKDLPTANNELGDTYSVKYQGETGTTADGNEYAWGEYDGTLQWIKLGVNAYTKDEINEQLSVVKSDILLLDKNKWNFAPGYAYSSGSTSLSWYKLAQCTFTPASENIVRDMTLYIDYLNNTSSQLNETKACLLKVEVRAGTTSINGVRLKSLINTGINPEDIVLVAKIEEGTATAELWVKTASSFTAWRATMISNSERAQSHNQGDTGYWTLNKTQYRYDNYSSYPHKVTITDYYGTIIKDLSDRITALENK